MLHEVSFQSFNKHDQDPAGEYGKGIYEVTK